MPLSQAQIKGRIKNLAKYRHMMILYVYKGGDFDVFITRNNSPISGS